MSTVTENITPAKAQEYLRTSAGNRPISRVYVRSYADTMKKGAWMLNGVPIIFDTEGHLLDGHHRLLAVIEANIPVRFDVRRGAPADAFSTYDTGRHRTVGQLIAMQGIKNYNTIGSIVNANEMLQLSGRLCANNTNERSKTRRTLSESYDAYCSDPEGYREAADYICPLQTLYRIISASWAGGLYYYLTHTGGYSREEVKPFFDCLFDPSSMAIQAAANLRILLTKAVLGNKGKTKLEAETLWVYIAKSWNAFISKTEPRKLQYDKSKERIPELILK